MPTRVNQRISSEVVKHDETQGGTEGNPHADSAAVDADIENFRTSSSTSGEVPKSQGDGTLKMGDAGGVTEHDELSGVTASNHHPELIPKEDSLKKLISFEDGDTYSVNLSESNNRKELVNYGDYTIEEGDFAVEINLDIRHSLNAEASTFWELYIGDTEIEQWELTIHEDGEWHSKTKKYTGSKPLSGDIVVDAYPSDNTDQEAKIKNLKVRRAAKFDEIDY